MLFQYNFTNKAMKRTSTLALFILLVNVSFAQSSTYDSIFTGGRWRTFFTYLPSGFNSLTKHSLVLAFHGGGATSYVSLQYQSRLSQKADSAGFILVYPEGVKIAGSRTFNAGGCCSPATTLNIDDVGFVNALLDILFKSLPVDTARVYATGFSNGALLCYRLANQLSNRIAAIAPVEGVLIHFPWAPTRAVPIISFHSYKDFNIPYYGGLTIGPSGTYYAPQDSIFSIISSNYSCAVKKEILFHDTSQYDHFKYSDCNCGSVIEQFVSYDGEHSWPGGLSVSGVTVSDKFSASYLMWEFFKKYTISCNASAVGEEQVNRKSFWIEQNYPNPFNPETVIKYSLPEDSYVSLKVYDFLGREVVTMVDAYQNAGEYSNTLSSRLLSSGSVSFTSGVYYYRIIAGGFSKSMKMIYLK